MKKLLIILLFLFPCVLNADNSSDIYAVERPDGGVSIVYYLNGSGDSFDQVLKDLGFKDYPVLKIDKSEIPVSKSERKYWKHNNGKIQIDAVKKSADLALKAEKEAKKSAALAKLKLTKQELKDAVED